MTEEPFGGRHSVFWRVAAVLVIVQLASGIAAIALSTYLASDRSRDLAENALRVRLDALAEEIERTHPVGELDLAGLSGPLRTNLSFRFPDPIVLVDTLGEALFTVYPDPAAFEGSVADSNVVPVIPDETGALLRAGEIVVDSRSTDPPGGWAAVPLYDASGLPAGGYLVQPLDMTLSRELAPTRRALRSAMWGVSAAAVLLAVILAGVFTWWLVRPLRRITARVEAIGGGDFETRIDVQGSDEISRLGRSVNRMADRIAASVEALRSTDRIRRELIANVGHDLRTPLAAVRGYIEEGIRFLEEQRKSEAERAFAAAGRQATYLQQLVDDLFELSQLENPSPQLRTEPVPLAELIGDVARAYESRMASAGVVFELNVDAGLPVISADGVRLMRVLDNLLSNAFRHTSSGERVTLSASVDGVTVRIDVADTGEGMEPQTLERIFDRYYRGEASRTRDRVGTGLGLAIARAVAELHGGTLTADSEPGSGTVMHLALPVTGAPGSAGKKA